MHTTSIFFGLLILLFMILLRRWMRRLNPQLAGFQSQRMCPSCGLITSRLKASCVECGKLSQPSCTRLQRNELLARFSFSWKGRKT